MEVRFNNEVWHVFEHEGTERFHMAQRVIPKHIDMDSDGRIYNLDRPELIPKDECEVLP